MKPKKIVFILNVDEKPRYYKRIEEFSNRSYDIDVYAFKRYESSGLSLSVPVTIIENYKHDVSFRERIPIIIKGVKRVVEKYSGQDVLYYIFGLDVASVFRFRYPFLNYIYEEGDLVHTYSSSRLFRNIMESIDKSVIRHSLYTVFTSEGFVEYHFKVNSISNGIVIPNKISKTIRDLYPIINSRQVNKNKLHIGFVGAPRFATIINFFQYACISFPQHEFHVFGGPVPEDFDHLKEYNNMHFHGKFKTPDDLPTIYSQLDLVLSTYDTDSDNVRYAEPNKLYEAIYFETPIIVSSNTFLSKKVKELGVGFDLEVNEENVVSFIKNLSIDKIYKVKENIKNYPKEYAIDNLDILFEIIDNKLI